MSSEDDFAPMKTALRAALEARTPDLDLEFKPMFGGVSAYVNGRVFATLSNVGLALKLKMEDQPALLNYEGAKLLQYEPDAPISKQYVVVPSDFLYEVDLLGEWVERSARYAVTLAQPKKKPKRKG